MPLLPAVVSDLLSAMLRLTELSLRLKAEFHFVIPLLSLTFPV